MNGHANPEASVFQAYVKERCQYLEICRRYHLAPLDVPHLLNLDSGVSLEDRLRIVRLIYRLREMELELQGILEATPFTEAAGKLDRDRMH